MICFRGALPDFGSLTALLIVLSLVVGGCDQRQQPAQVSPPIVEVVRPVSGAREEVVEAVGTVQRRHEFALAFRLTGVVTSVRGEEGDQIRAGQIVATLDPTSLDATLSKAGVDVDRARRNFERSAQLYEKGFVSTQRMQDERTVLQSAQAAQRIAAFDRRGATLVAPASGYVLERLAEPDEVVQAGQAVLRLADLGSPLIVRAALSDRLVSGLKVGAAARVGDGLSGTSVQGRISRVGARADEATGSVYVEIEMPATAKLRSGQVVSIGLALRTEDSFQRIPSIALLEVKGNQATVLIFDPTRKVALRRVIEFAGFRDGLALVNGLAANAAVITNGGAVLTNGQAVRVVDRAEVDS
jgi:RND family efflux transporter MFP subunit